MSSVLLAFDAPTTIKRELDLRILDANHERSSSPVLGIQTIPVSQFQVNFEKAVNLEIQRLNGTGSLEMLQRARLFAFWTNLLSKTSVKPLLCWFKSEEIHREAVRLSFN